MKIEASYPLSSRYARPDGQTRYLARYSPVSLERRMTCCAVRSNLCVAPVSWCRTAIKTAVPSLGSVALPSDAHTNQTGKSDGSRLTTNKSYAGV